eukprot:scaffold93928_cov36-Phaeocystis_antarctica.AAC.1
MDNAGAPLSPASEAAAPKVVASPFHLSRAAAPRVAGVVVAGGDGRAAPSSAPRVAAHFNLERPAPRVPPPVPPSEAPIAAPSVAAIEAAAPP